MRNQSYNFIVIASCLALVVILFAFLTVPRLKSVSAQGFQPTTSTKIDDIKGVGVIAFDAPEYRTELAKFLGAKAQSYPEAVQRYGLIVTNNTREEIVGYTVRIVMRQTALAKPVTSDLYLHDAVAVRNSRQYNIQPGEQAWIGLDFAVNANAPAFPSEVMSSVTKKRQFSPEAVIQSITIDSILTVKPSGGLKLVGPDKLNAMRKIQEERRAIAEVVQLTRATADKSQGEGKSLNSAMKEALNNVKPTRPVSIDGPTGDWHLLRKQMMLRRGAKLSEKYTDGQIAQLLERDLASMPEISK